MSDEGLKVGDRVQTDEVVDGKTVYYGGVITAIATEERERQRSRWESGYSHYGNNTVKETHVTGYHVKWDDGEEEDVSTYGVHVEDSEMERHFRDAVVPDATKRINEKLALAEKYLQEACDISEETGVPFSTGISFLSQSYVPGSFEEKFPEIDRDFMQEVCDVYNEYDGWEHSAVC